MSEGYIGSATLAKTRERIKERQQECTDTIRMSKQNMNIDGIPIAPSTAQTLRTRAVRDRLILQTVSELFESLHRAKAVVSLSAAGWKGLHKLIYPQRKG